MCNPHHTLVGLVASSMYIMIWYLAVDSPISCHYVVRAHLDEILLNCEWNLMPIMEEYTNGCRDGPCVHSDNWPLYFNLNDLQSFKMSNFVKPS